MSGWVAGKDEHDFTAGPYQSFEDALIKAPNDLDLVPGERFYIGERKPYEPKVDARAVIDQVGETTFDDVGDAADEFLVGINDHDLITLQETFQIAFNDWLKRQNIAAEFYEVRFMRRCEYADHDQGSYIIGD